MKNVFHAVLWTGCIVVGIAALYVLSYAMLVEVNDVGVVNLGMGYTARFPSYRIGGEMAETVFQPIHDIDCRLRPEVWASKDGLPQNVGGFF